MSRFGEAELAFGHGTTNAYDEAAYLHPARAAPAARPARPVPRRPADAGRTRAARAAPRAAHRSARSGRLPDARGLARRVPLLRRRARAHPPLVHRRAPARRPRARTSARPEDVASALDLCTGSGCLAILLAHAYPAADVDAVDISTDALTVAQRNVADYGLADRINLIRSDLFSNLSGKSYDLIISNPPYVTAMAMGDLPAEYRHEPRLALAGGEDGLDAVRTILEQAPRFLNPDGTLVVEVGHNRAGVELAFPRLPFVWLETASASDSVFLLKRDDLVGAR